jgi:hypothetical protein
MHNHRAAWFAVGLGAFCLPLRANAAEFAATLAVHVQVTGLESQAQLADGLRALGYHDVVLSSVYPSPENPVPEENPSETSHPEQVPVHFGWNGVAVKDGKTYQVYADRPHRPAAKQADSTAPAPH